MISIIIIVKSDRDIKDTLSKLEIIPKPQKTEIIVVDASEGKLNSIKKQFPAVNWLNFKNKTEKKITIPEQRNFGIEKSKGDIIVFIDANCLPNDKWLIELINPIKTQDEEIVSGLVKSKNGKDIRDLKVKETKNKKYLSECPTINLAIKRSVFNKIGFFDERFSYGSDMDWTWRAIDSKFKIRYAPRAIIYHDWGNLKNEIKRALRYGEARVRLYKKHRDKLKNLLDYQKDLFSIYSIIFFIYIISLLPLTLIFPYYPLFILIPIIKNIKINPAKKMIFDWFWGLGLLKELLFPYKK